MLLKCEDFEADRSVGLPTGALGWFLLRDWRDISFEGREWRLMVGRPGWNMVCYPVATKAITYGVFN